MDLVSTLDKHKRFTMAKQSKDLADSPTTDLVKGVVEDVGKLLDQQFQLLRAEFQEEVDKAKGAAVSVGAGLGMVVLGGILGTQMTVHALHRATGLPLWSCYGIVGGLLGGVGMQFLTTGVQKAADLREAPAKAVESIKENVSALGERVSAGLR